MHLFAVSLTVSLTLAFPALASICPGIPTPTSCNDISACHWCIFGTHSFCTSVNQQCPPNKLKPKLNGIFHSESTFEVFNFTESSDNKSIAIVSLNGTFTPATLTIKGQEVSVKLSNENVPRTGFIVYLPPPGIIYWQSGSSSGDVWRSGPLPPPPSGLFPLMFKNTLFHSFQPTLNKTYNIYSITTNIKTGSYTITSVNNTFSPTTAQVHGASGNVELLSAHFTSINSSSTATGSTTGSLRSIKFTTGNNMSEFNWLNLSGTGEKDVWRLGGTPPPLPPPPIEQCNGNYNQELCTTFKKQGLKCEWCVSNDNLDQLCFTSTCTNLPLVI